MNSPRGSGPSWPALARIAAADTGNTVFPAGLLSTDALEPKVSTYHSYASGIVSDYGLRLGVERDVVLLGGAQSFQLASEVVEAFDGDYEHFRSAKSTLVKAVIQLAGECAEHLQDPAQVRGWLLERIAAFESLPYVAEAKKNPTQAAGELSAMLRTRASVADMVGRYSEAKRARGALDFGDLVALAARVANEIPVAAQTERQRYKVVLLDEFQDTSHAQLVLFSRLFGDGHAVTAVGDPNQSIYGFRGASAGQLFHFVREFPILVSGRRRRHRPPATAPAGTRAAARRCSRRFAVAPTSYLTTAWRNGRNILATANLISAPLSKAAANLGAAGARETADAVEVPPLQPSPAAVEGRVVMGRFATDEAEAAAIAGDVLKFRVTDFDAQQCRRSGSAGHGRPLPATGTDGMHSPRIRSPGHSLRNRRARRAAGHAGNHRSCRHAPGPGRPRPLGLPHAPAGRRAVADRPGGPDGPAGLVQLPGPPSGPPRRPGRRRRRACAETRSTTP